MLTLEQQIARKCIHFNGVINRTCDAGVNYADVRFDKPYQFPCLKQGGECSKSWFRTQQEVKARVEEIEGSGTKALVAMIAIKDHIKKTKEQSGKIPCQCGGELHFAIASVNKHIRAMCKSCGINFTE